MILWLKARRIPLLAVGLALYAGVAIAAGSLMAKLPTLTSTGAGGVPLMLFAPLPACVALIFCLESGSPGAEGTASRRVARYDQARLTVLRAHRQERQGVRALGAYRVALTGDWPSLVTPHAQHPRQPRVLAPRGR